MGKFIDLTIGDITAKAYVALPQGAGPHPGVVVTFHKDGLDDFTEWLVDDLARNGYGAIAPDHYHAMPPGKTIDDRKDFLDDDQMARDLKAAVDWLGAQATVDGDRVALVGHCMGGRTTLLGAGVDKRYKAACIWYGGSAFKALGEGPSPVDRIPNITAKVIGFFGNDDKNPSPDDVSKIDAAMTKAGVQHIFHRYDKASHAFMNNFGDRYVEAAAKDSWAKAAVFLKETLGG